jgi:transposase
LRALEREVFDVVWEAVEPLIPVPVDRHPLGCHRPRIPDWLCLWGMLVRLVTGCSWTSTEKLLNHQVSDTTLRARRDEWVAAGVFDQLRVHALKAYDRIVGLDLSEVAVDGCQQKAPCGGEGTGKNPVDRAKMGWKWSVATDRAGIPLGWAIDGANVSDLAMLEPTLADVARNGLLADIETLHLDKLYDFPKTRRRLAHLGFDDLNIPRRRSRGDTNPTPPYRLGLRWIVESANSWLTNYGQLRRNTDRRTSHRHAQLCFAAALIITIKLIDWRNRWSPPSPPIR